MDIANKHRHLFTADQVVVGLDNSDDEEEFFCQLSKAVILTIEKIDPDLVLLLV